MTHTSRPSSMSATIKPFFFKEPRITSESSRLRAQPRLISPTVFIKLLKTYFTLNPLFVTSKFLIMPLPGDPKDFPSIEISIDSPLAT